MAYHGIRNTDGSVDVINLASGEPLDPRFDLRNHSPDGFNWGYGGSGPAQLALAILCDYLKNDQRALALYQSFKFKYVAGIQTEEWTLLDTELDALLIAIQQENDAVLDS